jgi:hypothetical protein
MNLKSTSLAAAFLAGITMLLSGCSTTGYKQADKTGAGIAEYRAEVLNVKKAVDDTLQSMNLVEATANTNPRHAFDQFSKSVNNLDAAARKAKSRGDAIRAQGEAYFVNWQQQIAQVKNPEIKKLAEERKAKLWDAFQGIKRNAEPLRAKFDPWLSDLKDLQRYLSNDLTIEGVDAARKLFSKAKDDGADVQKSMEALVAELNSIAAALTPANVPPAPASK